VAAAGCEHFGLLVGMRADAACLGLPGFLLSSAPDVGTALRVLAENLDLHDRGGVATLQISGEVTLLGYAIHQAKVEAADYIYDISMAQVYNILRGLCGERWKPTEVLLSRRPPQALTLYRRFYRAPLHFNASRNAIAFPTRWLDHIVPGANALLHRYLAREARERHKLRNTGIVTELRGQMRKSLLSGEFGIGEVARRLCLHERTLHRRLRDQGTSFSHELEDIRYELARQLLADSRMPVSKIAKTLKYANLSGFNRAFKRWAGITPGQWRALNAEDH
jgi:AraC-like DNA-binding protein